MRILSIANISNVDDLACDSGLIFQRIIGNEMVARGHDYVLVGPDIQAFRSVRLGFPTLFCRMGTTRYDSRFSFDWEGMKAVIEREMPDVIFNNQIELSSAIRSVLVTVGANATRLFSYCHYPAIWGTEGGIPILDGSLNHANLGYPILRMILAALETSDKIFIQSEFAKSLLATAAEHYRIGDPGRIRVIPPPADPKLMRESAEYPHRSDSIVYNHRLYESYGTGEFVEMIRKASEKSGFRLLVADPMLTRSSSRQSLSGSPAHYRKALLDLPFARLFAHGSDRKRYSELLAGCRLGIAALRRACVWSMSVVDCLGLNVPVIGPDYAAYPEMLPPSLLFADNREAMHLIQRLLEDDDFWLQSSRACRARVERLLPSSIAERMLAEFRGESHSLLTVPVESRGTS